MNRQIRAREVRLIDDEGEQHGVVETREALRLAEERGLDLVEVAPNAVPPVCRIMDFGKYLYQEKKKQQEAKKKQKVFTVKEVKFRPMIDPHDYDVKLKRLMRFLGDGDKVKATVQFRGREMARMDLGYSLLKRLEADAKEFGMVESSPERAGNRVHQIFAPPRKGTVGAKRPEAPRAEVKSAAVRSEPSKAEPVKAEPAKAAPAEPEQAKPEPTKPEPTKPEPTKPEPTKPAAKAETAKAKTATEKTSAVKTAAAKTEPQQQS
jgi:translation initiation factor IF-3